MNKRIKKLAADARGQMVVLTTVDDEQWRQHEEFVEKFAELIVRECCDIFVELRTRPADLAAVDVKNHFGVK
jgi:tagatose-1,6-bisphosphate aldolase